MSDNRRRRYLIDAPVQLGLVRRLAVYAAYCLITAILLLFFWRLASAEGRPAELLLRAVAEAIPLVLALAALLPFVVYDLLKLTNRFAGPAYRVRVTLDQLARGKTIRPVRFREGDYWIDLASQLNVLADRLGQLQQNCGQRAGDSDADLLQEAAK